MTLTGAARICRVKFERSPYVLASAATSRRGDQVSSSLIEPWTSHGLEEPLGKKAVVVVVLVKLVPPHAGLIAAHPVMGEAVDLPLP